MGISKKKYLCTFTYYIIYNQGIDYYHAECYVAFLTKCHHWENKCGTKLIEGDVNGI